MNGHLLMTSIDNSTLLYSNVAGGHIFTSTPVGVQRMLQNYFRISLIFKTPFLPTQYL